MISLWKKRLKEHQSNQLKYLRLVFNDQFVIALIFLIGSIGFWYSNFLKTVQSNQWWGKPVLVILLLLMTTIGQLATLLQKADGVFLLPKEKQLRDYLLKARAYSLILPIISICLAAFILSPFATIVAGISTIDFVLLALSVVIFKVVLLDIDFYSLYQGYEQMKLISKVAIFIIYLIAIYSKPIIALICAILIVIFDRINFSKLISNRNFLWTAAIKKEDTRSFNIKRFYNLFTDVPGMSAKVKRRKYLDFIPNLFKADHKHTYLFIFVRGFIRNNEYIGLFVRLTILQLLILFFARNVYLAAIILMLFIYLVGFQLKPFYKQYSANIMQKIYPVDTKNKISDFKTVVLTILLVQWILCVIPVLYNFGLSLNSFIILILGLAVIILFLLSLPNQLKKLTD